MSVKFNVVPKELGKAAGFTLIELMIVVAIIGILASVAVPQYKIYVDRAKVSEAIAATSFIKIGISEYIMTKGIFPEDITDAGVPASWTGTYSSSVYTIAGTYNGFGIQLANTGNTDLNTKFIYMFSNFDAGGGRTTALTWYCAIPGGAGFDPITAKYVPSSCREDYRGTY